LSAVEVTALMLGCGAVAEDLRRRSVANWLTVPALLAGLGLGAWNGGVRGLLMAVAGSAVGFLLFWICYRLGGLGGGDVKLMAAFGALLGPSGVVVAGILAAIAGALVAALVLLVRPRAAAIPYAPAIALGAWLVLMGRR
jgi:prepilin peptidase CpaA